MPNPVFYVTQDSLDVWDRPGTASQRTVTFPCNDEGLAQFEAYIECRAEAPVSILVDVIEEEFSTDKIPLLRGRDRKMLIARRLTKRFPRTQFRLTASIVKKEARAEQQLVVLSAVSNPELLDPWLNIMLAHNVPITGVNSVPLLTPRLLSKLHKLSAATLFFGHHQGGKIRQVFVRSGIVRSARLPQAPEPSDDDYAKFVIAEVIRSRRYLERSKLLGNSETLEICAIVDPALAERILGAANGAPKLAFSFISPAKAASSVGLTAPMDPASQESVYVALSASRLPGRGYAVSGETRYFSLRRVRRAFVACALSVAFIGSIACGLLISDAWNLYKKNEDIESTVARLSETLRRENQMYEPIQADSHEMQTAVDTADFILGNRVPVTWVMQQLGGVLGDFPDIQVERLNWAAESEPVPEPDRRSAVAAPVSLPRTVSVRANLSAKISGYDGDLRGAFERIDTLANALRERTAFDTVVATEYPIDARPEVSITGEIGSGNQGELARFQLSLNYLVDASEVMADESTRN